MPLPTKIPIGRLSTIHAMMIAVIMSAVLSFDVNQARDLFRFRATKFLEVAFHKRVACASQLWFGVPSLPDGGSSNGHSCLAFALSCASLFKLARCQVSQNLKRNVGLTDLGRQSHHGGPVASGDAPRSPTANRRDRLFQRTSNRASASQSRND